MMSVGEKIMNALVLYSVKESITDTGQCWLVPPISADQRGKHFGRDGLWSPFRLLGKDESWSPGLPPLRYLRDSC
jgi:hypothetical protein